jgi:hypothetical protein
MDRQRLHSLLSSVSGHVLTGTLRDSPKLQQLQRSLSRSLFSEDIQQLKTSSFSFENADLFSPETIPGELSDALKAAAAQSVDASAEPEFRAFVREVPVRSTQLPSSLPKWAAGAAVDHTIGPFTNKDGRQFWFDFFKIEKLVALYIQGKAEPVLLFKVNLPMRVLDPLLPPVTDTETSYKLPAGSIWINSQVLAANSPVGLFTGLTIKSGTIKLSAVPQVINGKLTAASNTTITLQLHLAQPKVGGDETSPYGVDARTATLQLPDQLNFHFSGQTSQIDDITSSEWNLYGQDSKFDWNQNGSPVYDNVVHRILIPLVCSNQTFSVEDCESPLYTLRGKAPITGSAWALPAAAIDILNPTPAAGIGGILATCGPGLSSSWKGRNGGDLSLNAPYLMLDPGRIAITDLKAGNLFCTQTFKLWKDEQNSFGTTVELQYPTTTPLFYDSLTQGDELLSVLANANVRTDRPVTVAGEALPVRPKNSLLILAGNKTLRFIYLFDDNILADNTDLNQNPLLIPKPIALALRNALFKVTPVSGCALFGVLDEDFVQVTHGFLFLSFGVYAYLPTLPDPYAANLRSLQFQFREAKANLSRSGYSGQAWLLLVCQIQWQPKTPDRDAVEVSFHFAPLTNQFQTVMTQAMAASSEAVQASPANVMSADLSSAPASPQPSSKPSSVAGLVQPRTTEFTTLAVIGRLPDYGAIWDENTRFLQQDVFSLLDVSTNADLLGVSFGTFTNRRMMMLSTHVAIPAADPTSRFPLQVQDMDVVSQGTNVRAFTVPQISWEPVLNLTPPAIPGDPSAGPNYYPNDGGPARIVNNSTNQVALAPIPLTQFLVENFKDDSKFAALALFTLPWGLKALALLQKQYSSGAGTRPGADLLSDVKSFRTDVKGALHLQLNAGAPLVEGQGDMFVGSTVQLNNVLELDGTSKGNSTLGASITKIFNNEFLLQPFDLTRQRGVPLTRIDLSGYGASTFSNWLNPKATIAETSQARFDVFVGRCGHEIIQVKSILYPWGVHVVRTITLLRAGSGYAYRWDSGWRAESDGRFDFTYYVNVPDPAHPGQLKPESRQAGYEIHPGVVYGLFNIREIKETTEVLPFTGQMVITPGQKYVDENGQEQTNGTSGNMLFPMELQPVFFNADVAVENPISGFVSKTINGKETKVVASKRILGFVQIAPRGMPITVQSLRDLVFRQGTIGGPLDCVLDINSSGQHIRLNRFDFNNSFAADGSSPIFAAAGRGTVILPKDGAWSMVKHEGGTGGVSPVPQELSVPLIRIGALIKPFDELVLSADPTTQLLRVANPTEILRSPAADTISYGLLHATDTQKALFLTPSYAQGVEKLLSKTPPLFADAFRVVNSKAIFPNIGDAVGNFGDAINLVKNGTEFAQNALTDSGKQVFELMQIDQVVAGVKQQGYQLLKKVSEFDLPNTSWTLIELGGAFKIYIEYKASNVKKADGGTKNLAGSLDYDVNSFANNLADTWKSRMSNAALVVDLGPIKRLMTIKGTWDAKKGAEAEYKGSDTDPDFPSPQIEFAPELKPAIEILQILEQLQSGNYKDAFKRGLKLAMSNKAGAWEYKLEASKEIPVVRFPTPDFLYNDPNAPLKLEAGLKLGAYFNAALKVTTDPNQLLPTAGAYLGFYGRLSVMCVSLSVATIYAVGQANLDIAADTLAGPSLHLKFGFGAQIVVGLPVVGNVSVLYMVGVEMFVDSVKLNISAFLLFQGHAEILGGIVGVTIMIEAKGTVSRANDRTDLAAQVTFGLDISIFLVIDISFSTSWQEQRQIA